MSSIRVLIEGKTVKNGKDILKLCSGLYDVIDGKIIGLTPFEQELLNQKQELLESTKSTLEGLLKMSKEDVRKEIETTYKRNRDYANGIIKDMKSTNARIKFALLQIGKFNPASEELKKTKETAIKQATDQRGGMYSDDDFDFYRKILDAQLDLSDEAVDERFNAVLESAKANVEYTQKDLDAFKENLAKRQIIRDQLEKELKRIKVSYKTLNRSDIRKRREL